MQLEFPKVGQRCWVTRVIGYPLPEDLPDRTPVTVMDLSGHRVTVRSEQGEEWELPRINVDSGYTLILDGQSVHESNPKFAAYFRHSLVELTQVINPLTGVEELISKARWYLERNGFDPDAALPLGPVPCLGCPPDAPPRPSPRCPQSDQPRRMRS